MCVLGVALCGIAVAFFKISAFGVDPFQSFMSGTDALIPLSYGTLYVIVNGILLLISVVFNRRMIGLATVINMLLLGYVVQFTFDALQIIFPDPSLIVRIILLLIGIIMAGIAAALYFTADMGVSTYDAVALIISEKQSKIPFKYVRVMTDVTCVVLGTILYLVSGNPVSGLVYMIGIGTIISAFFTGPMIEFFKKNIAEPMLNR